MDCNNKNTQGGFTLIEIIIVIFVTVILLMGFFSLYDWHGKIYNYQQALVRVSGSSRDATQSIFYYTDQAYRVLASSGSYTSGAQTLILHVPAVTAAGDPVSGKWDTVIFYTSGSRLFVLIQPDAASTRRAGLKQLSDTLQSLTFSYNDPDFTQVTQVSLDITTSLQVKEQTITSRLTQDMYLKNYY